MEKDKSWTVSPKGEGQRPVRLKPINRQQLLLRPVEVEKLVEEDHPVRAIWELVGQLNLEPFYAEIQSVEGVAGRPVWDPQLLISLWIYAYKDGVSSAREIGRLCQYHPAYQWLTGLEVVNYHTLADFRVCHKEALDQLFIEVLGVLSHEGLITLQRVMHDGTKVKACASDKSFRRKATLQDHLRLAREQVEQMGDPESEELSQRVAKARQRALREKREHLEEALKALEQMEASRSKSSDKTKVRVSTTDPEARVMLHAKGAYGPGYNVQLSTDAEAKIIVGVGVTQAPTDAAELEPAVDRVEANLGEKPKQMVVDAGFTNQATMEAMAEKHVDLIGTLPERRGVAEKRMKQRGVSSDFYPQAFEYDASADCYRCPAEKVLHYETEERSGASVRRRYRAKASECRGCAFQAQCCPGTKRGRSLVRSEATPEMAAFQAKMETPEAQAIYKQRAGVAEFPNAWIKDKIGLRQFRLRGLVKVTLEALWACLTYNICQWIRLCWKPQQLAQAWG
ncbi:MAG: IS1182 family transposase [Deltaproteobacteria bacterium]